MRYASDTGMASGAGSHTGEGITCGAYPGWTPKESRAEEIYLSLKSLSEGRVLMGSYGHE